MSHHGFDLLSSVNEDDMDDAIIVDNQTAYSYPMASELGQTSGSSRTSFASVPTNPPPTTTRSTRSQSVQLSPSTVAASLQQLTFNQTRTGSGIAHSMGRVRLPSLSEPNKHIFVLIRKNHHDDASTRPSTTELVTMNLNPLENTLCVQSWTAPSPSTPTTGSTNTVGLASSSTSIATGIGSSVTQVPSSIATQRRPSIASPAKSSTSALMINPSAAAIGIGFGSVSSQLSPISRHRSSISSAPTSPIRLNDDKSTSTASPFSPTTIPLSSLHSVTRGYKSKKFQALSPPAEIESSAFSLSYHNNEDKKKSIHFFALNTRSVEVWYCALNKLITTPAATRTTDVAVHAVETMHFEPALTGDIQYHSLISRHYPHLALPSSTSVASTPMDASTSSRSASSSLVAPPPLPSRRNSTFHEQYTSTKGFTVTPSERRPSNAHARSHTMITLPTTTTLNQTSNELDSATSSPLMSPHPVRGVDVLPYLLRGAYFLKFGRHGSPKFRYWQLSSDGLTLSSYERATDVHKKAPSKSIDLRMIDRIQLGFASPRFKDAPSSLSSVAFSIHLRSNHSLIENVNPGLAACTMFDYHVWTRGLVHLVRALQAYDQGEIERSKLLHHSTASLTPDPFFPWPPPSLILDIPILMAPEEDDSPPQFESTLTDFSCLPFLSADFAKIQPQIIHAVPIIPPASRLVGIELNPGPTLDSSDDEESDKHDHSLQVNLPIPLIRVTPQTLFQDGLRMISAYLDQSSWVVALRVCHHWLTSFSSTTSRELSYPIESDGQIIPVPSNHMLHHITRVHCRQRYHPIHWSTNSLLSLGHYLPFIRDIINSAYYGFSCVRSEREIVPHVGTCLLICWPHALSELEISLTGICPVLLRSISTCTSLERCKISGLSVTEEDYSAFQSYGQLTHLHSFTLSIIAPVDHVKRDLLAAINWNESHPPPSELRSLDICHGEPSYFDFHTFCQLRFPKLERVSLQRGLDHDDLHALAQCAPSLTELNIVGLPPSQLPLLKQFGSLKDLTIGSSFNPSKSDYIEYESLAISSVSRLIGLTSLHFVEWIPMQSESWLQLSSHLQKLEFIIFDDVSIESFDAFHTAFQLHQLTTLAFIQVSLGLGRRIRDYFRSPLILPNLQHIIVDGREIAWNWTKGEPNADDLFGQFRLSPQKEPIESEEPATVPISGAEPPRDLTREGIEPNPGPLCLSEEADEPDYSTQVTQVVPGRLLKDMIHLIVSFLTDPDWVSSMCVCHHWLFCGASSPSRDLAYPVNELGEMVSPPPHRLLHHFTSLDNTYIYLAPQLFVTCEQLPHLTAIHNCTFGVTNLSMEAFQLKWPKRLCVLEIRAALLLPRQIISSIFSCLALTELFMDGIPCLTADLTIFEAIHQLVHLRTLYLFMANHDEMGQRSPSMDVLAAMRVSRLPPHLISFNFCEGDNNFLSLTTLSQLGPAEELDGFGMHNCTLVPGDLKLLHSFAPNISLWNSPSCHPTNFIWLKEFHSLRTLHLITQMDRFGYSSHDYELLAINGLRGCMTLTNLRLTRWMPKEPSSWARLAESLTRLMTFCFSRTQPTVSLDVLLNFHSLTHLTINGMGLTQVPNGLRDATVNYFASSLVMPQLQSIYVFLAPEFMWVADDDQNQHYRSKAASIVPLVDTNADNSDAPNTIPGSRGPHPPAATPPSPRLVGIESNPGPLWDPGIPLHPVATCLTPASSTTTSIPTAQTLFVDGLLSIFGWLPLPGAFIAFKTCHYWRECGLKEKSRQISLSLLYNSSSSRMKWPFDPSQMAFMGNGNIPGLLGSPFKFHVTTIDNLFIYEFLSHSLVELDHLKKLSIFFPLRLRTDQSNPPISSLCLPNSLRSLEMHLMLNNVELFQSFLNALPQCAPQLQRLKFSSPVAHVFDLSPLLSIPTLLHLTLSLDWNFVGEYQHVCANLPLTSFACNVSSGPNWTIFHPESKFMMNIQEVDWAEWIISEADWNHLITYPPPRLRQMTLSLDTSPQSFLGLPTLHLHTLVVKSHPLTASRYASLVPVLQQCHSLTALEIHASPGQVEGSLFCTEEELILILGSLPNLKRFELYGDLRPTNSRIYELLPSDTFLRNLIVDSLPIFLRHLSQAKQINHLRVHFLTCSSITRNMALELLPTLCQQHCQLWTQPFQVDINRINQSPINFIYQMTQSTIPPATAVPGARLVGVELNPGPTSIVSDLINSSAASDLTPTPSLPETSDTTKSTGCSRLRVTANTLFKDDLHCVYAYLTPQEFMAAIRTSHHWYQSAHTAPTLNYNYSFVCFGLDNDEHIPLASPLSYHFTDFSQSNSYVLMASHIFFELIPRLPHLTDIQISLLCDESYATPINHARDDIWPSRLRTLVIHFPNCQPNYSSKLVESIWKISTLTRLAITGIDATHTTDFFVNFDPAQSLQLLVNLTDLTFTSSEPLEGCLAPNYRSHPFSLPSSVTALHIDVAYFLSSADFSPSLTSVTYPHLRQLRFNSNPVLLGDLGRLVRIVPNLEILVEAAFCSTDFHTITHFQHLNSLELVFNDAEFRADEAIIRSIGQLESLTHLILSPTVFSSPMDWYWLYELAPNITSLEVLFVNGGEFTPIVRYLPHSHLTYLKLIPTELTRPFLDLIGQCQSLVKLVMDVRECSWSEAGEPNPAAFDLAKVYFNDIARLPKLESLLLEDTSSDTQFHWVYEPRPERAIGTYRLPPSNPPTATTAASASPSAPLVGIELNPGPISIVNDALVSRAPTASSLFVDGILLIFQYLSFKDLLPALQASHYWHSCGLKESSRQLTFEVAPLLDRVAMDEGTQLIPFKNLLESPFRFHIGTLNLNSRNVSEIGQFQRLPNLHTCICHFTSPQKLADSSLVEMPVAPLILPSTLTNLRIHILSGHILHFQDFIDSISTGTQLTHIMLSDYASGENEYHLAPLQRAPKLTSLHLSPNYYDHTKQELCASLPLTKFASYKLDKPDWGIFHPQTPFWLNVQALDLNYFVPSPLDWKYLLMYPPPKLTNWSISVDPLKPIVGDLASLHLTSLELKLRIYYHQGSNPDHSAYVPIVSSCHSLSELCLTGLSFTDDDLLEMLKSLKQLDKFCCLNSQLFGFLKSLQYLPRESNFSYCGIVADTFDTFTTHLTQATRLQCFHLSQMKIRLDSQFLTSTSIQTKLLHQFCQSMKSLKTMEVDKINGTNVSFNYVRPIDSHPPAPPLVGVELNPGPLEPSPVAVSCRCASVSTSSITSVCSAHALFKDGLFMIYSYLSTLDWSHVYRTCHHWYDVTTSERSRQISFPITFDGDALYYVPPPRLLHHFTSFHFYPHSTSTSFKSSSHLLYGVIRDHPV